MPNYIETLELLSKSPNLREGKIKAFTREILTYSSETLKCNRSNAWLFEEDQTKLVSLLAFDASENLFVNENSLSNQALPNYFKFLKKNELIVSNNAKDEPINLELLDGYIFPNNITSMIDVPLRSEGEMIGVICFEHVEIQHVWSDEEQKFTLSLAQLLSLALETNKKRKYRNQLEKIIKQKEILIAEINHRVKNNMAVIISLLNLQKNKAQDSYHSNLIEEVKDKVYSMSMIQEQLHANGNVDRIYVGIYLRKLIENLNDSYGQGKNVAFDIEMDRVIIDVSKAIPCGLIANEILTNSFKYAFNGVNEKPLLKIRLKKIDNVVELVFHDNGSGFDLNQSFSGMGLELIKDLAAQIGATIQFHNNNGLEVKLSMALD